MRWSTDSYITVVLSIKVVFQVFRLGINSRYPG
ncbi:unnamed protein product [Schistosoma mattheei]|uniref:Uncharacterized protein n=1 Tax=Schistosoma mattheei TaxID=31246 RepID=A0A3P8CDU7_9TREM|nr:unnamed protein product [Schistosoma mattheei]